MRKRLLSGLLALCLLLGLAACGPKATATWQGQYDLGVRYLAEGNYEEAILAFEAAIGIDPARAEAYAQLADAYLAMDDPEGAARVLSDGVAATGDAELEARLAELSAPAPEPTPGPTTEPTPEPTPEPTTEPTPEPSEEPTPEPSEEPGPEPSEEATPEPTPTAAPTYATSGTCGPNAWWSYDEGTRTLTIGGSGAMDRYGYGEAPWSVYADSIRSVVMEYDVDEASSGPAFEDCTNLTSFTIVGTCGENLRWSFFDTTADDVSTGILTISGSGAIDPYGRRNTPWSAYVGSIRSIIIEPGVTSVGESAFQRYSNLTSIAIPNSVTSIGNHAFSDCTGLTSVTIPGSVTEIGINAFVFCTGLSSITFLDGVTTIGGAFAGCTSLTSITIPNSVTTIKQGAFTGCDSLTDVYYTGTEEQWAAMSVGYHNDDLLNATIHYNSPG